jgi:hypothetical protein
MQSGLKPKTRKDRLNEGGKAGKRGKRLGGRRGEGEGEGENSNIALGFSYSKWQMPRAATTARIQRRSLDQWPNIRSVKDDDTTIPSGIYPTTSCMFHFGSDYQFSDEKAYEVFP